MLHALELSLIAAADVDSGLVQCAFVVLVGAAFPDPAAMFMLNPCGNLHAQARSWEHQQLGLEPNQLCVTSISAPAMLPLLLKRRSQAWPISAFAYVAMPSLRNREG
ncbi:unnamed protein product [Effrenium voratum]|nr:unnamed protein product [Effrenium voratum]